MRLGCSSWTYSKVLRGGELTLDRWLEICADELKLDGVEICWCHFPDTGLAGLRHVKRQVHSLGLGLAAVDVDNTFNVTSPSEMTTQVERTKHWIDIASFLGAPVLRVFYAGWGDLEQARSVEAQMLEATKLIAAYAEERAVILACEDHGPLTRSSVEMRKILTGVGSEWYRVCLDFGNFVDGYASMEDIAPLSAHTHTKMGWRDAEGNRHPMDFAKAIGILKRTGYRGYVCIEQAPGEDAIADTPKLVAELRQLLGH